MAVLNDSIIHVISVLVCGTIRNLHAAEAITNDFKTPNKRRAGEGTSDSLKPSSAIYTPLFAKALCKLAKMKWTMCNDEQKRHRTTSAQQANLRRSKNK